MKINSTQLLNAYEQARNFAATAPESTAPFMPIEQIFEEKKDAIKLMTIHKSKGLENERVFLITKFDGMILQPWKYAKKSWELVQERNLMFVAYTRAKSELILFEI